MYVWHNIYIHVYTHTHIHAFIHAQEALEQERREIQRLRNIVGERERELEIVRRQWKAADNTTVCVYVCIYVCMCVLLNVYVVLCSHVRSIV